MWRGTKGYSGQAPSAAEQQAQWDKLTPEQRAAVESIRNAAQSTIQQSQTAPEKAAGTK